MRAAIYNHYGPPEVVQIQEVHKPSIRANQILVRVRASTVNRTDCGFRSAQYFVSRLFSGLLKPKHKTLGCEFAGEVTKVGAATSTFKVGDRIFGYDDSAFGGHAEYKVIDEKKATAIIPEGIDYTTAAALTEGSHYALCNIRSAKVKANDIVMVYGATGAIGSAAIQLLKHFGAYVVAVAGTPHINLVRSLGADECIDYMTADFTKTNYRFNFIFDAVGKSSFGQCKSLLKSDGIYISTELGKRSENIFRALIGRLYSGKKVLFPFPLIKKEDVILLSELAKSGTFKPLIDRKYALDEIVEAYRYVETGKKVGNVIIDIT